MMMIEVSVIRACRREQETMYIFATTLQMNNLSLAQYDINWNTVLITSVIGNHQRIQSKSFRMKIPNEFRGILSQFSSPLTDLFAKC